jgi:hypothetical protein
VLDFATHCLKQSQKGKSIYNKLVVLSQILKQHGFRTSCEQSGNGLKSKT